MAEMNELEEMISVGKVRDSHGLKGELFVVTNLDEQPAWVKKIDKFKLQYQNPTEEGKHTTLVSEFSVKKIREHKKGFIVSSKEIEDRNQSDLYKGAIFYISKSLLTSKAGERIYLNEVKGFEVFDGEKLLGTVVAFSSNNAQDLLVVKGNEQEVEIPFVEEFIKKIEWDAKKLIMELPEGLY